MFLRPLRPIALLLGCIGSIALGCGRSPSAGEPINVLLISMDTTRADSLGAYGHPEIETPNIDRLAAEGVLFEQCSSPAPLTVPTHASMMTGTYPFVHGVRDNGDFVLGEGSETLAEVLTEAGWATGAQVAVFVLDRHSGLDQGFGTYRDTSTSRAAVVAARGDEADVPISKRASNELRADEVADGAIDWLSEHAGEPFFLFAHFFDPHAPYEPPESFLSRYDSHERDPRASRYLGEIAYVDQQIGRLLDELERLGLDERTLVVLTADHGEAFGEHSEIGHSYFVYDTTMQVPLILRLPGRLAAGRRIAGQVRSVDIAPTIVDLLGVDPLPAAQGVSLARYAQAAGSEEPELDAYLEAMAPYLDYRYSPLRGLRDGRWKYILAPQPELYDLAADPSETENVHDSHPEVAAGMRGRLRQLLAAAPASEAAASGPNEEARERLESLGYVGRAASPGALVGLDAFEPAGPDPKDRIEQMIQASTAQRAFNDRDFLRAEELYRELSREDPQSALFAARLADTLLAQNRGEEALASYRFALELDPDHVEAHRQLARLHLARRDLAAAAPHLAELTRLRPQDPNAFVEHGRVLAMARDLEGASRAFEQALELDPANVDALDLQAKITIVQGDWRRAVELMEAGLAERPDAAEITLQLAWLRATCPDPELRDGPRALELAERAADLETPPGPRALLAKAAALAANQRWQEAAEEAAVVAALPADTVAGAFFARQGAQLAALYRRQQPYVSGEPL